MKTNTKAKIKVGIATERTINNEFINAWKRAEHHKIKVSEERLYFSDVKTLLHVLSEKRLALLQTLRCHGSISIKSLCKLLGRNYSNVYNDVRILSGVGLIRQTGSKEVYVPWNKIQTEIDLTANMLEEVVH